MFTNTSTRSPRALIAGAVVALVVVAGAAPAFAKHGGSGKGDHGHHGRSEKAPRMKLRFKLVDHKVALGDVIEGRVYVMQQLRGDRSPVSGATVSIRVGGEEVSSVTTGDDGKADVSLAADDAGDHVMRAVLENDGRGRVAQRSQGFRVFDDADEVEDEADVEDDEDETELEDEADDADEVEDVDETDDVSDEVDEVEVPEQPESGV